MDYKMLKNYFFKSHLDVFATYVSDVGDENGEYICDGEVIPGQVELQRVGWLLLDIGKGCPRGKMQETAISSHILGEW